MTSVVPATELTTVTTTRSYGAPAPRDDQKND